MESLEGCRIISSSDFTPAGFRWLQLKRIVYSDQQSRQFVWESVERSTRVTSRTDGVAVLAQVRTCNAPPQVLLVAQFRPSVGNWVVELPAGLIDAGETIEQAAARELLEETGYTGCVVSTSPVVYGEPGMTNNSSQLVILDIDGDDPINHNPKSHPEPGEVLQRLLLPTHGALLPALLNLIATKGWDLDARLFALASGMQIGEAAGKIAATAAAVQEVISAASPTSDAKQVEIKAPAVNHAAPAAEKLTFAAVERSQKPSDSAIGASAEAIGPPPPALSTGRGQQENSNGREAEDTGAMGSSRTGQPDSLRHPPKRQHTKPGQTAAAAAAAAAAQPSGSSVQHSSQPSRASKSRSLVPAKAANGHSSGGARGKGTSGRVFGEAVTGKSCVLLGSDGEALSSDDEGEQEDEDMDEELEMFQEEMKEVLRQTLGIDTSGIRADDMDLDMLLEMGLNLAGGGGNLLFGDDDNDYGDDDDDDYGDDDMEEDDSEDWETDDGGDWDPSREDGGADEQSESDGSDSGRLQDQQAGGSGRGTAAAGEAGVQHSSVVNVLLKQWQKQPEVVCCFGVLTVAALSLAVLGAKAKWSTGSA